MFMDDHIYIGSTITIAVKAGDKIKIANTDVTLFETTITEDGNETISTDEWTAGYYTAVLYHSDGTMEIEPIQVLDPFAKQNQLQSLQEQLADVQACIDNILSGNAQELTINNKTIQYLSIADLIALRIDLLQKINNLKKKLYKGDYFKKIRLVTR
ncbi:hypothetical protein E0U70_20095 [Salmonella enterica subsp. enterica serovar Gloucester]|nr:hypothetical protein [Salmonella enterica subsp. enterica serovar Gloucester]